MLQSIRDLTSTWFATLLLIVICIPFVFWGADYYFGDEVNPVVAEVNGVDLHRDDFLQAVEVQRQAAGRASTEPDQELRQRVLKGLIESSLVLQFADRNRMRVSSSGVVKAILEMQFFQEGGLFSRDRYDSLVNSQGRLHPADFEAQVRREMTAAQVQKAVLDSGFLLDDELRRMARLQEQRRDLAYVLFSAAELQEQIDLTPEEVELHYQDHEEQYQSPEQVRIAYLELREVDLKDRVDIDEEELSSFFESRSSDYDREEQRAMTQVSLHLPVEAAEEEVEAARARAEEVLKRGRAGESLEELIKLPVVAEAESESESEAADADGSPDSPPPEWELLAQEAIHKGMLPPPLEAVLFALQAPGDLSAVVHLGQSLHIVRLDQIEPEQLATFENSRPQAEQDYRAMEAKRWFLELTETLATLAYEHPESLEVAAEALDQDFQQSDYFSREAGEEIASEAQVREAAFQEEVLHQGNNSDLIELGEERVLVLRVDEHKPAATQPFSEVEARIRQELQHLRAVRQAREQGQQVLEGLERGEGLEEIAVQEELEWQYQENLARDDAELNRALLRRAFRLPWGGQGQSGSTPSFAGEKLGNGDYAVLVLQAVHDLEDDAQLSEEQLDALWGQLAPASYLSDWRGMVGHLRAQAKIQNLDPES